MQKTVGAVILLSFFILLAPLIQASEDRQAPFYFSLDSSPLQIAGNQQSNQAPPPALPRVTPVQHKPMTGDEKLNYYLRSTYGLQSIGYSVFGAGIKHARGNVEEWGGGMEGYGRRFASTFGQKVVRRSVHHGLSYLFHEDPRYFRSNKSGIFERALYAASQTLVAHKDSGGTRIAYTRFIATGTGAYVSRQWHPERYHELSNYLSSTATTLGIDAAKNVFNEFWPDIKKMLRR